MQIGDERTYLPLGSDLTRRGDELVQGERQGHTATVWREVELAAKGR